MLKALSLIFFSVFCFFSASSKNNIHYNDSIKTKTIPKTNYFHSNYIAPEFNNEYLAKNFPTNDSIAKKVEKAIAVFEKLNSTQNYLDLVSPDDLIQLPVGIKKEIGNLTYTLGISKTRITPNYTEVTAFVKVEIPQSDSEGNQKQLFFGADNIKLSHTGGIYGDANLVLLGDIAIPINGGNGAVVLKGGFNMKTGSIDKKTYVTIDCNGFKEMGISADVLFPRSMLEPVDENYKVNPDTKIKVKGHFETVVSDWNDILAEISLPPFQLKKDDSKDGSGKAGLIFELNTAVFDFSDIRNSPNVNFPKEYNKYLIPGNKEAWRGVYVKSLKVVLPKQFKKKKSEKRVAFEASDLLIDGMGVSGNFSVDNILPLDEGEASKWQFSVDHIDATFVTNTITKANFNGHIVLPISKEVSKNEAKNDSKETLAKKALQYSAVIDPTNEEYVLTVTTLNDINFSLFKAQAKLTKDSYIELKVKEGVFRPKAVLHGSLSINGSNSKTNPDKSTVDFKGITFQNLQLQTEAPYFKVDYMGYSGKVKFANFPVTISEIGVTATNTSASLEFAIDINMMSKGFSGGTKLAIVGKFKENEGLQRWKFDKIKIKRINVKADLGSIKLEGFVDIKDDDPVYGDGFYGELSADFNGINVKASAWFGKTDFRYWYVDAYVDLSKSSVKITIGPAIVNGFGGGAYYRMSKKPGEYSSKIPTGLSYIPDGEAGLGFRALIGFALANEKAFNGKVGFEMAFNRHGGLNRVLFFGEGHIVKALDFKFGDKFKDKLKGMENKINDLGSNNATMNKLKESNLVDYSKVAFPQDGLSFDVGIDAHFSMEMDFQNHVFHSEMEVFVNTPGGFLQGVGPKGRAGWAVFHIGKGEWYMHMGTPSDRVGLKIGIGSFFIKTTSYLMIGDNIPGSPAPPAIIAEILGEELDKLDYMRDLNALGDGRGFAFGMDFSIQTGDISFLMFYANFQAGFGFDIMIKDYGETACEGSGAIGIDGWYANGQSYAYMQGKMGINVNLLFIKKRITILEAGGAMLLQAKLPNPAWFRGYLGGYYNLLGGLVKGSFRFKVELGEECEIVGGAPLGGIKVISDISPSNTDTDVDVFTVPQVAFNMAINKPFELEDDEGVKTYRILLDEFKVTQEGTPIEGSMEWSENKDLLNFVSFDILAPKKEIKMIVKVSFQELIGSTWETIMEDGQIAQEIEEISFTTGEAPDFIPLTNIVYTYPVIDQNYFYQNERNSGYVKLKRGQPYLFAPETDWTVQTYFKSETETKTTSEINYDKGDRLVNFSFPALTKKVKYAFSIISIPPGQNSSGNDNTSYTSQETGQEGNTVEIRNKKAEPIIREGEEVEILVYNFTTSTYNTFSEKINDKKRKKAYLEPIYSDVHALQVDVQPSERFDKLELLGGDYTASKPLIATEAVLDDNYYKNGIYPLIYEGYPLQPQFTVDRDINDLGLPPKKGVDILTWYPSYLEHNPNFLLLKTRLPYRYYLPYYYKQDFIDIQYKIVNTYLKNPSEFSTQIQKYKYIISGTFPAIYSGDYKVKLQYVMPGGIKGSSAIFNYNNPF